MNSQAPIPRSRYLLFFCLAIGGCLLDLWTKHVMFAWQKLSQGGIHWVIDGVAGFQTSLNEGALFGMGQGGQFWFALLSVMAAIAIPVWLFRYGHAHDLWMTATLGGISGGVLGNLYDRAGLHGLVWGIDWPSAPERFNQPIYAVRDWILLQASNDLRWPNFNIADALLVCGAATLFVRALREPTASDGDA
ncbi:MAG: signal peptidase II [Planctomycetota bacterium]